MQKISIEISERLLDEITAEDARAVKARLEAAGLSQRWLERRLEEDYGIKFVSRSNLCDLLHGRWAINNGKHNNGRKVIFCAREILERYDSVFPQINEI